MNIGKAKYPRSYTNNYTCGCVEHITDKGYDVPEVSRDYCKTHGGK